MRASPPTRGADSAKGSSVGPGTSPGQTVLRRRSNSRVSWWTATNSFALYYFFDLPSKLADENKNLKRFCLVVNHYIANKDTGETGLMFNYFAHGQTEKVNIAVPVAWKAAEWHHVAITWDGEETALFLDGERKGVSPLRGGLFGRDRALMQDLFVIGGLWNGGTAHSPECTIDELRISETVRYLNNFTP